MGSEGVAMSQGVSAGFGRTIRAVHVADGVQATAAALVDAALILVPSADDAGVALPASSGDLRIAEASSATVRTIDQLQRELSDGPLLWATGQHELVAWGHLKADRRWRRWGLHASQQISATSVMCIRLVAGRSQVGALYLYSAQRDAFDSDADRQVALLVASHGAVAIDNAREINRLRRAVLRKATIAKAIGILMVRRHVDEARAQRLLESWASQRNQRIDQVAADVVRCQEQRWEPDEQSATAAAARAHAALN